MAAPTKANVARPAAWGYDCLIDYGPNDVDSLYVRLAVGPGRQMQFQTVEPTEEGPAGPENPEDLRSESGRPFSRSSFSGGQGLDRAHRRDGTDRDWSRFWDSRNVDVSPPRRGDSEAIRLLHSMSSLRSASVSTVRQPLIRVGDSLFGVISDPEGVDRTDNPTAASPTWSVEDPFDGGSSTDVTDLAALGSEVYAAASTFGIYQRTAAGVWSQYSTPSVHYRRLWGVKGRLVAADGFPASNPQQLVVVQEDPDDDLLLHTLTRGNVWTDVVDAGAAILAAATDGYVYAFAESDGELVLKGQTFFPGEYPTALGFGQGLVFIATAEDTTGGGRIGRLYRTLLVGLQLRDSQVLREWGDGSTTEDRAPQRIVTNRESAWVAVVEDATETHLWRYHFSTGGLVRDLIVGDSGPVHGLAVFDDRLFVNVWSEALWRQDTTYAAEGWLISPLADFFTAARKAWVGARLATQAMPANTTVTLFYSTDPAAIDDVDHASWTQVIAATPASPGDDTEQSIVGAESRWAALKVVLATTDTDETPETLSFTLRGLPLPTEDDYAIPVNISDQLELPHRKRLRVQGLGGTTHDRLRALIGKAAAVTLLRSSETVTGQIRAVSAPINELPERGSPTVYALMTVRGARQ